MKSNPNTRHDPHDFIAFGSVPDQERYSSKVADNRELASNIAKKIRAQENLSAFERKVAAGVLLAWAAAIPDQEPKRKGRPPTVDAGDLAIHYALLVNGQNMKPSRAIKELAEGNGISDEAVREALKKFGAAALRQIPKNPNQIKK